MSQFIASLGRGRKPLKGDSLTAVGDRLVAQGYRMAEARDTERGLAIPHPDRKPALLTVDAPRIQIAVAVDTSFHASAACQCSLCGPTHHRSCCSGQVCRLNAAELHLSNHILAAAQRHLFAVKEEYA